MQVIESLEEMKWVANQIGNEKKTLAWVPTMGALHPGHLHLIKTARKEGTVTVVSIFVNPIQFGPSEDLSAYPHSLEEDLKLCEQQAVDIVFIPKAQEVYAKDFSTYVVEEQLSPLLGGLSRPQLLKGYATVLEVMRNILQPTVLVLGAKDLQQTALIRRVARDLHWMTRIKVEATVREPDGLAFSASNRFLSTAQRAEAIRIYEALKAGRALFDRGITNIDRILAEVTHLLTQSLRIRVLYVAMVDADTLKNCTTASAGSVLAASVWVDTIRLNDNIVF